ncbi:hypothetical protein CDL12_20341 [Handroanthus impetiginosus]|uniref:ZF-HD dimerization-type domain-containing protein n=1 Tax=Handroanthus impetiginosus TaxID=429701 RepID=A0A2G9GPC1_9LAMI|nr:hypothetical protein CDL12_20341 [Handroanthus impetiginosus]
MFCRLSEVKLPLAPILSTPPDRRGNAMLSTRRGSSIFSPTQTLDQPYNPPPHHHQLSPSPPPLPQQQQQLLQKDPTSDPDPLPPSTGESNSKSSAPAAPPQPHAPPPQTTGATTSVKYRECLKNHAANMGGHVVDGCGEFMPSGEEGTVEALKCAACDCHRNFHRREVEGEPHPPQLPHYHRNTSFHGQTLATHFHKHHHSYSKGFATGSAPPTMVNFGSGRVAAESSSEDLDMFDSAHAVAQPLRKRFRTKFSQEQKHRMQEFAVKLGWRIQKQDEQELQQFCDEVGVKRQVFKVWMHNNKQAMKKSQG